MKISMKMDLDNDAFWYESELDFEEIRRVIEEGVKGLMYKADIVILRDRNGNNVGSMKITKR